jgi:perosamine synthetase
MIPYGHQNIDQDDIDAVLGVLKGDWLTQGPAIEEFEQKIANYVQAKYAVAFSSGTAALHAAASVSELGPNSKVVTSPLSFMASANCARYVGATPRLVDISSSTWNLETKYFEKDLDGAVVVHFAGLPVNLSEPGWAKRPRVVIEDAAHALGATTPYGPVGNCAHSDLCCFSFHPVKSITSAEGGMVTTNSAIYAQRLIEFRSHGIVRDTKINDWYYQISRIGYNLRLTDIAAALGASQMNRLEFFIESRNKIADNYRILLEDVEVDLPPAAPSGYRHSYHLFPVLTANRDRVFAAMRSKGVGVQVHYIPIHHQPISADTGCKKTDLPICNAIFERIVSLPIWPGVEQFQNEIVEKLKQSIHEIELC